MECKGQRTERTERYRGMILGKTSFKKRLAKTNNKKQKTNKINTLCINEYRQGTTLPTKLIHYTPCWEKRHCLSNHHTKSQLKATNKQTTMTTTTTTAGILTTKYANLRQFLRSEFDYSNNDFKQMEKWTLNELTHFIADLKSGWNSWGGVAKSYCSWSTPQQIEPPVSSRTRSQKIITLTRETK